LARIRTIKPEFPQSESMGRVSRDARLLFVMLWPICDDHGRTRAASRMLASLLFPYDDDAPSLIDGWLAELEREGCIRRYTVEGSTFLEVCNWLNHQKIDKPSKPQFPGFDEGSPNTREDSRTFVVGKEGKGREKDQEQERADASRPPSPADADEAQPAKVEPVVQVVLDAYHRHLPSCQAVLTLTPKRRRLILSANKVAKSLIAQRGLGVTPAEFWDGYFAECADDPWLSGKKPNPQNPGWKQNLEVLLRDEHLGRTMDKALARDLGSPA
jgi:hypothetical protein